MSADTPRPAVGSREVHWVITGAVEPGDLAKFKQVVAELVDETRKEAGSLDYRYSVADDQSTVNIFERYRDSDALVFHVTQTFGPYAEKFLALLKLTRLVVYGTPSTEAKNLLAAFGPVYMTEFDGFSR